MTSRPLRRSVVSRLTASSRLELTELSGADTLDVARFKEVDHLQPAEAVTLADLAATAAAQGVTIERHDLLLIRTGWLGYVESQPAESAGDEAFSEPGIAYDEDLVAWFHEHEIALLGTDNFTNECWVSWDNSTTMELHVRLMRDLGVLFSELNYLDGLQQTAP